MSFYSEASLAYVASAGASKDGKAYSMKPVDGTGDFTFSRGSNLAATRVGPTGLIEKGRENLLLQSNQFDTTWGTANSPTLTSGQSGYDGSSDAWLLSKPAASFVNINQNISISGVVTYSVYLKAGTNSTAIMRVLGGTDSQFFVDLSNGTSTFASATIIDYVIEDVGSGWYRTSISVNDSGSVRFFIYPEAPFSNTTAGNIYIQDAQVEIGLAATDYIESGATTGKAGLLEDEPRFDYSGGATCPSLLLEPSRTNLSSSEYFEQFWSTSSGGTRVYNQITSPEGVQNGTKMYPTQTGSFKGLSKAFGSSLSSTPYALSIFAKAGEFEHLYFYNVGSPDGNNGVWFNLTTGSVEANQAAWTSAKMEDFGNGWYRCSAVITPGGSSDNLYILLADLNGSVTATTNGTDGLYIYGAQIEQGSYPTSYIPNHSGGTITRGADAPSNPSATSVIGQTEGTLFIDFLYQSSTSGNRFSISDGTATNWVFIATPESGASSRFYIRVNSSIIVDVGASSYFVSGQQYKLALAYKSGDWAAYGNGIQLYSGTNTIPSFSSPMDTINFKSYNPSDVITEREKVNQVLFFDTRLSNADLATLTTI